MGKRSGSSDRSLGREAERERMEEKVIGGRYVCESMLGKGGNGSVFLCHDLKLQKKWAVKELHRLDENSSEPELLKTISCNVFPRIVDVVYETDKAYLVMDYVEGSTLADKMQRQKLTEAEVLPWAIEIAKALNYLHQMVPQILYMDCKPENIMLTPQGEIRLVDLGSVYICQEGKKQRISGTRFFAPVEHKPDVRSDIYAFGMTLYYLLAGKKKIYRRLGRLSVKDANPSASDGMDAIIARCTQTEPEKRPQSMEEVLYLLTNIQQISRQQRRKNRVVNVASLLGKWMSAGTVLLCAWMYAGREDRFTLTCGFVAVLIFRLLCMKRKFTIYEVKKEVFCGSGKRVLLHFLLVCSVLRIMTVSVFAEEGRDAEILSKSEREVGTEVMTEKEQKLEVILYDKAGRKLLLQDGMVWKVSEDVLLSIPLEVLEETQGVITVSYEVENSGLVKAYQFFCCRK